MKAPQIIPVMIEQVTLPPELRYQLSSIQMIEMPDLSHQRLSVLIRALRSRPWKTRDAPVIIYAPESEGGDLDGPVGYLVKSPPIDYVLETIYQALDLDDVSALTRPRRAGQTWLDARTG